MDFSNERNSPDNEIEKVDLSTVLFDMDGVLINSFHAWHLAMNDTLIEYGNDPQDEKRFLEEQWGLELFLNIKLLGMPREAGNYCCRRFTFHMDEVIVHPKAEIILSSLENYKLGLVTNTPEICTKAVLEHFQLLSHFSAVLTRDHVHKPKPHPEMIFLAMKKLGRRPNETILIGDTRSDVGAGHSAGIKVIGIGVEADYIVNDLGEIGKIIEGM